METKRHQVIPRTSCLVFNDKEELLLLKFSEEKGKMAGFFDPPGGHIEYGEGIIENAVREIKEETDLEVKNTMLRGIVHVTNFFGKNIMLFVTSSEALSYDAKESNEGTPHWIDPSKLDELKIFDDIKRIVERVGDSKSSEIFTARSEFDDNGKMIKWEFDV
jgi:8-oxo-dGTP diphosphatase